MCAPEVAVASTELVLCAAVQPEMAMTTMSAAHMTQLAIAVRVNDRAERSVYPAFRM
jgi:hypothetical protein